MSTLQFNEEGMITLVPSARNGGGTWLYALKNSYAVLFAVSRVAVAQNETKNEILKAPADGRDRNATVSSRPRNRRRRRRRSSGYLIDVGIKKLSELENALDQPVDPEPSAAG